MLLFGVSHRSAPVSVLERLSTDESDQAKILDRVLQSSLATEAMVLSTRIAVLDKGRVEQIGTPSRDEDRAPETQGA